MTNSLGSLLTTQRASGRREARRANSRGFLNPWKKKQEREMASVKTRNGNDLEHLAFNDER